jgi:nitrite reductase (NADH) small subunit
VSEAPIRKPLEVAFEEAEKGAAPKLRAREIAVGRADEVPIGGRKIVQIDNLSIGIFHLPEGFYALRNYCPHQGAPLCEGSVHGTNRPGMEFDPALEGRVLRCPWHGWEFDIPSGKGLYDLKSRVSTYGVRVSEEGELLLNV